MSETREERRLAAIVIGDVVGYSRLMGLDEVGTMTALKAHRRDLIQPLLSTFRARLVNTTGDAMLLEFGSAVDAVSCAAAIQRGMIDRNDGVEPDRQLNFRLGINLGDIVIDGSDIYGDGVNVAARLESLCDPGGLCLSRAVEEQVRGKLALEFEDRGEHTLKNIARPVQVFALTPDAIAALPETVRPASFRAADATQLQVSPGTTLNDAYAIDRLIGSGGMGEIFRGHEIHTGDAVAIKLIRMDLAGNETVLSLFQKEASILKHVYHEAVVRYYVFSFDQAVRRHYLAMEYVDGPSLSEMVRPGPLSFEAVEALRKRGAAGLAVAHERGVIHRDVSPDNIIVPDGDVTRAKIIDFGIARSAASGAGTIIGGGFAGKYNYVSPEQLGLFGGEVTARSDIYSFGLVLAEALRGEPLNMGGTQAETVDKRRVVPDLSDIDPRLRSLLAAMLQPDPTQRPDSMTAVAQWSTPVPVQSSPGPATGAARSPRQSAVPARRHVERWIIGATLAAALIWGAGLMVMRRFEEPPRPPPSTPILPSTPPTENGSGSTVIPQQTAPPQIQAAGSEQSATAPPPDKPPAASTPVTAGTPQRIAAFVEAYEGGPCFYAKTVQVTEAAAGIEGFAASAESLETFDKAFVTAIGFEPNIIGNRVWSRQCPAVAFLRLAQTADTETPKLFLRSTRLRKGQGLVGEVGGTDDRAILLLRVREDGTVEDVSAALTDQGDAKGFDTPLTQDGTGGPYPQMIIAIASPSPLPAPRAGETADTVFPALLKASAAAKAKLGVTAKLVLLGG